MTEQEAKREVLARLALNANWIAEQTGATLDILAAEYADKELVLFDAGEYRRRRLILNYQLEKRIKQRDTNTI